MSATWRTDVVPVLTAIILTCAAAAHAQDRPIAASVEVSASDRERLAALEAEAIALAEAGDYAAADERIVTLMEIERRVYGESSPLLANSYGYRANLAQAAGDTARAVPLREQEAAIRERAGDPLALAVTRTDLAVDLATLGRHEEAEPLYRAALATLPVGGQRLRAALGLANTFLAGGRNDEADDLLTPVLEQAGQLPAAETGEVPQIAYTLAVARYNAGRLDAAEAPARAACGEATPTPAPVVASACFLTTLVLADAGRATEAEPFLVLVLAAEEGALAPGDRASAAQALAAIRQGQERATEIEPLLRTALDGRLAALGEPTREQAYAASALGVWLVDQDRPAEAEPFNRQALDLYQRSDGPAQDIAIATANVADTLVRLERHEEAAAFVRQAMANPPADATAAYQSKLVTALLPAIVDREPAEAARLRLGMIAEAEASGATADVLAGLYSGLANDYGLAFDWTSAVAAREKALAHYRAGTSPLNTAIELSYYGRALAQVDDYAAAYAALSDARTQLAALPASEEDRLYVDLQLASVAERIGRLDEALALIEPVVAARRGASDDAVGLINTLQVQAEILTAMDRLGEAEAALIEARALAVPGDRMSDYRISVIDTGLALLWQDQGRFDEAEQALRDVIDTSSRLFGPESLEVRTPLNNLAMMLNRTGRRDRALVLLQRAAAIEDAVLPADAPTRLDTQVRIARQLSELGQVSEAEALLADLVPRTAARLGEDAVISREARRQYGLLLVLREDYERGIPELERVVALERDAGLPGDQAVGTLQLLAYATYNRGEYARTIELMQEAVRRASPVGATRLSIDLRSNLGKVLIVDGRPAEALAPLREATARSIQAAAATQANSGAGAEIARDPFRVLVEAAWMASR